MRFKLIRISLVISLAMILSVNLLIDLDNPEKGDFLKHLTPRTQRVLKNNIIQISETYFTDRDEFEVTTEIIKRYLDLLEVRKKAFDITPVIEISIVSGGGRISYFEDLQEILGPRLKQAYVKCDVGFAGSMAFTFMVHFCDERRFYGDTQVMQHQVYLDLYGYAMYTDNTIRLSRRYNKLEADALGIDEDTWWEISRMQGDKFFDSIEEKQFNLQTN